MADLVNNRNNSLNSPSAIITDLDTNKTNIVPVIETIFNFKNSNSDSSNTDEVFNKDVIHNLSSMSKEPISILSKSITTFEENLDNIDVIRPDKTIKKYTENFNDNNNVFHNIKDTFRGMDIDLSNIMLYAARTMEMVEVFNSGSGIEKKELVVNTIMKLIDDNESISEEDKDFIEFMIDGLVETILKTSKKEIILTSKNNGGKTKTTSNKSTLTLSIGQIVDSLVDKCVTIIKTNKYKAENIIINIPIMAGMVMSIVETYSYLNGTEKKTVVIKVIQKLIKSKIPQLVELDVSSKRKLELVSQIIPSVIDILVEIANGKYKLNEILGGFKKMFSCCKSKK